MADQNLYQKIDTLRQYVGDAYKQIPHSIGENLRQNFELRPYQEAALRNYVTAFENQNMHEESRNVLFLMATGSGKTLIMAALILYLYSKGYRDFLFFVNRDVIIKKSRENFLNQSSPKYLFADSINIGGQTVKIREVKNFADSDPDAINLCLKSIQKLQLDLFDVKENSIAIEDFVGRRIVMISDEAHHLNTATITPSELEDERHWETTVNKLFDLCNDNILLEFTATIDEQNKAVMQKYKDNIVFNYPLSQFRLDGYSKEIATNKQSCSPMERALLATITNQYRLKVFEQHRIFIKPVMLLKSRTKDESRRNMKQYMEDIANLKASSIAELREKYNSDIMKKAFSYFQMHGISDELLASEIRDAFSERHCITANNEKEIEETIRSLNTLEESDNPYRAVFAVDKLNEGWDVLNLFDIVRLFDTVSDKEGRPAKATVQEAQLIGRGARLCPFRVKDSQDPYKRKYDDDTANDLRVCEELYYHCTTDRLYIAALRQALRSSGMEDTTDEIEVKLTLKPSFKETRLYQEGYVWVNARKERKQDHQKTIRQDFSTRRIIFKHDTGEQGTDYIFSKEEINTSSAKVRVSEFTLAEIGRINYNMLLWNARRKALEFARLKKNFPNLKSLREFLTDESYLGKAKIFIESRYDKSELSMHVVSMAVAKFMDELEGSIGKIKVEYDGTREFFHKDIKQVLRDRVLTYSRSIPNGQGISQKDAYPHSLDLSQAGWYAFNDNYGTSEEKAFVKEFSLYVDKLKERYDHVYLVRNEEEQELNIYSFDGGKTFQPDFILFLQKGTPAEYEQVQIFIEPKGNNLLVDEAWKEQFLMQLSTMAKVEQISDKKSFRVLGFHFYNQQYRSGSLDRDIKDFLQHN